MRAPALHRPPPTLTALAVAAALAAAVGGLSAPVAAQDTTTTDVVWTEVQQQGARLGGAADVDGIPGDELLVGGGSGGLFVGRADGSVLWRYTTPERPIEPLNTGGGVPSFIPDVDGDARSDVLAKFSGSNDEPGAVVVLSGATGALLWRTTFSGPTLGRAVAADLNRDGAVDVVVPTVVGQRVTLQAFLGPAFAAGWSVPLPEDGYLDPDGLDVAEPDGAGAGPVVVAGTRQGGGTQGAVTVIDAATGEITTTIQTAGVFAATVLDETVVTHQWQQDVEGVRRGHLVGYALTGGSPRWTVPLHGHIKMASWQIGDLDADGGDEVVVASAPAQEGLLPGSQVILPSPSTAAITAVDAGGRVQWVHKVNHDAFQLSLAPREGGGADVLYGTDDWQGSSEEVGLIAGATGVRVWLHEPPATVYHDAVEGVRAADVDGDGTSEAVYTAIEQQVTALSMAAGAVRGRWSYPGFWTTATAGDLDLDGRLDLIGGGPDRTLRRVEDGATRWALGNDVLTGPLGGVHLDGDTLLATSTTPTMAAYAVAADSGALRWRTPAELEPYAPASLHQQAFGDLTGDGHDDVVMAGAVDPYRPTVVAVDGRSGDVLWRFTLPQPPAVHAPTNAAGMVESVAVLDGAVVATLDTLTAEDETPSVLLLDGATGALRWAAGAPGPSQGDATALLVDGRLIVAGIGGAVSAHRWSDGTAEWTTNLGQRQLFLPFDDHLLVVARGTGPTSRLSAQLLDGQGRSVPVRSTGIPAPHAAAVVPGAGVVLATSRGIFVLDPTELRGGNAVAVAERHLAAARGEEYPVVEQVVTGQAGGAWHAVGLADQRVLTVSGVATTRGMWVLRLGS